MRRVKPSDNALVKILSQQKKTEEMQTGPAIKERARLPLNRKAVRTARLYMNGKVLAISLYENDVEVSYLPASSRKVAPFNFMQQWVEHGIR